MLGLIKFEGDKHLQHLKNPVRCASCFYLIEENSDTCDFCGVVRCYSQPKTLFQKLKRWLGIEMSSEIIVLSIGEPDSFFSEAEIDSIVDVRKMNVLDIEDVPDWNLMFYKSRRIGRPGGRAVPHNRLLTNSRQQPKLPGVSQGTNGLVKKRF